MLIFTLKNEWFEKIRDGEKTTEYRVVKPYWTKRLVNAGALPDGIEELIDENCTYFTTKPLFIPCNFTLGYTGKTLCAVITRIEMMNGKNTDLKYDGKVYAIHFNDVRQV